MCVVAFALDAHPRWRFVLAGNRDEFHARPSAPLARWADAPGVIAGRDLVSGGSWLGVSEAGRVAVVTNVRNLDGADPKLKSRGALITDWLAHGAAPESASLGAYNPFTLCVIGPDQTQLLTNRPIGSSQALAPGLHSLSNGECDQPWPRRTALEGALAGWIETGASDPLDLFEILSDETPRGGPGDAAIFVRAKVYGTRCSTIIAVTSDGQGLIVERRFSEQGEADGEVAVNFAWDSRP